MIYLFIYGQKQKSLKYIVKLTDVPLNCTNLNKIAAVTFRAHTVNYQKFVYLKKYYNLLKP